MNKKHILLLGLAALLAWSGPKALNVYYEAQTEEKRIQAQVVLSREETRRFGIMREAIQASSAFKSHPITLYQN